MIVCFPLCTDLEEKKEYESFKRFLVREKAKGKSSKPADT